MKMYEVIAEYLETKTNDWSPSTLKSERHRLLGFKDFINGDPKKLMSEMQSRKLMPYTKTTTWTRVIQLWNFHRPGKDNPYKIFRKRNRRLFKNSYSRSTPQITFEDAKERISRIKDVEVQKKALELLVGGLRYSESFQIKKGIILGKGDKERPCYLPKKFFSKYSGTYHDLWFALKKVGLTPHDLRKIRATDLARRGMDFITLCKTFGWSTIETARSYCAPIENEKVKQFFEQST